MKIEILNFGGLMPKLGRHLLPDGGAVIARDCRIGSGMLKPLGSMRKDHRLEFPAGSMFRWKGEHWFNYEDSARSFVPGPVYGEGQRLFMSREAGGLTVWTETTGEVALGVPAPLMTPTLEVTGNVDGDVDVASRAYVYTCVNSLGDESAPSAVSEVVDVQGQTVVVGNMTTPPHAGYAPIVSKRIYRLAVGDTSADYQFVAEIDANINSYTDELDDGELGEALPTMGWKAPAADLTGLVAVPGNVLAAFHGQEVRFSEPNYPYAWPDKYAFSVEYDIVGIAASNTTLFILTTGPVYLMSVDSLDGTAPVAMDGNCPCLSRRGIMEVPVGVIFPSRDGLYVVGSGYAKPMRLTADYYDLPDWLNLNPASMFGAWCGGYLYVFYEARDGDKGGLIFDLGIDEGNAGIRSLTTTEVPVSALTVAAEGERLFVASGDFCWEWEGLIGVSRTAEWRSRSFLLANKTNFSAAVVEQSIDDSDEADTESLLILAYEDYIEANGGLVNGALGVLPQSEIGLGLDGAAYDQFAQASNAYVSVVMTVYADGKAIYTRKVTDREPFVLPAGFTARTWFVRVTTNRDLRRIAIAESMEELYA